MNNQQKVKTPRIILWLGMAAAGIFLLAMLFLKVRFPHERKPSIYGNTTGNIIEYGSVLECEAGIFYANNGIMYSRKENLSAATEVYAHPAMYLNYYDGWLYFSDTFDGYHLCRIRPDGTEMQVLIDMHCEFINIIDETLYFSVSDYSGGLDGNVEGIYCSDLNGEDLTKISEDAAYRMAVYKNKIYYIDDNTSLLTVINPNGQHKKAVFEKHCYTYAFYENTLYIATQEGIYSSNINNSKYELILPVKASNLIADGEYLFYSYTDFLGTGKGEPLSMFNVKTGETTILLDETCFVPCIGLIENQVLVQLYDSGLSSDMRFIDLTTGEHISLSEGSFAVD